ncbi:membrane protein [Flavobacterium rivuli WB 3.3-2 = DSM 21788]|uniref:Membrane protein n=1 Tax=Flavobacterium rivuli WB 3.3-2 = DSM 21788 TaxID=1121895 RepID=A0A0A2M8Y2_9FLAO|nr:DUF805 domain-containing protein [Flavobacterium rivuli]KGO84740.1 membrane protein [Flavobacterium rivuli WB 3.3-2 = DSM 21788]
MFDYYLKVVRDNYANFEGRARRAEYWYFYLFNTIIGLILQGVDYLIGTDIGIVGSIYSLAVLIPTLAVLVRRLHDTGKSGWYALLLLFIVIGWIWLLVLVCTEGDHGPNEYGADPKNPHYGEFDDIGKPDVF